MTSQNFPQLGVYEEPPSCLPTAALSYDSLCEAFSLATGQVLQFFPSGSVNRLNERQQFSSGSRRSMENPPTGHWPPVWSAPIRSQSNQVAGHLQLTGVSSDEESPAASAVIDLAQLLGELLNKLTDARRTAETLATEIAIAAPLSPHRQSTGCLSERLQSVLQATVASLECAAAGMYILDDATSELQLRSMWGLPVESLTASPRILETAKADLEAMLGHAVVLTDSQMFDLWRVPEREYESAVCVPLSTVTTVLGTVWIFHDQPRTFEDRELNLIEVLAGRLAVELEHAALVGETGVTPTAPSAH